MKGKRKGGAAFTLIEMVMVLAIVALLLGTGIKYLTGVTETGRITRAEADVSTLTSALKQYEIMALSKPTTAQGLGALVAAPVVEPLPKRWVQSMTELPLDPWGRAYEYSNPGTRSRHGFDLFSKGKSEDDPADDLGNF